MDKGDEWRREFSRVPADTAFELTEAQRVELFRRSKAHQRVSDEAVELDMVLRSIEDALEN